MRVIAGLLVWVLVAAFGVVLAGLWLHVHHGDVIGAIIVGVVPFIAAWAISD